GLAALIRRHPDDLAALQLGLEGAADATIGTGGDDAVLGLAGLDDRVLHQRRGRAGLHAGTAGHAFAVHEALILPGRHEGREAAAVDRQCECALHLLAGPDAARADDAFRRIEGEIRVRAILLACQVVGAVEAVARLPQPDAARHVLEFAIAVGGAGQAVERVVGDVEFHDVAPQLGEAL